MQSVASRGRHYVNHGQIGRAGNCMELHPVILIDRVGS